MFEDFLAWDKQNENFINELKEKNSLLYSRIYDVKRVLDYLTTYDEKAMDSDLTVIFETGYAYLFNFVNDIKLYLENYFQNNLTKMLEFEDIINYDLYVCEIKDSLIDDNLYNEIISSEVEYILTDIEYILIHKKEWDDLKIEDYNNRLCSVLPMDKPIKCVDEVFVDVYEALKMD